MCCRLDSPSGRCIAETGAPQVEAFFLRRFFGNLTTLHAFMNIIHIRRYVRTILITLEIVLNRKSRSVTLKKTILKNLLRYLWDRRVVFSAGENFSSRALKIGPLVGAELLS